MTHTGGSNGNQLCTSGVSCADLASAHGGWTVDQGHDGGINAGAESQGVCGESDNGLAGGCTVSNGWAHANQICTDVGARLCTVTELTSGETRGSGCGFDRQMAWSSNVANCPAGSHMAARGSANDDVYCENVAGGYDPCDTHCGEVGQSTGSGDRHACSEENQAGFGAVGVGMLPRCDTDDTPNAVRCCADTVAGVCTDAVCNMDDLAATCGSLVRRNGMTWVLDNVDLAAGSANTHCNSPCYTALQQAVEQCDTTDAAGIVGDIDRVCAMQECSAASDAFLAAIAASCCSGTSDCSNGVPTECSDECAEVFTPLHGRCGDTLFRAQDDDTRVQIATFAQLCSAESAGINLALGRPCRASSLWSAETQCSNAIDGDRDHSYPNLFHTDGPRNGEWFSVQLADSVSDPVVKVYARDCCTADFGHTLFVDIASGADFDSVTGRSTCVTLNGVQDSGTYTAECPGSGNIIYIWADGWLELAEVQVFENPSNSRSSTPVEWKLQRDPLSWGNAQASCRQMGGDLASIHSKSTERDLMEIVDQELGGDSGHEVWIGLNDVSGEAGCDGDSFVWSDGSDNDWSRWAAGEPNDWVQDGIDPSQTTDGYGVARCGDGEADGTSRSCTGRASCDFAGNAQWQGIGGEDCAVMSGTARSSAWNDGGCSTLLPYMCHGVAPPRQTMVENAFILHMVDEMISGTEGYDSAEAVCRSQGRGLASIHNGAFQAENSWRHYAPRHTSAQASFAEFFAC